MESNAQITIHEILISDLILNITQSLPVAFQDYVHF
jgi:hypothetical protein